MMERKSQCSSLALTSGRTGVSLKRRLRRRRKYIIIFYKISNKKNQGASYGPVCLIGREIGI
jgi:hypothetical protein